MSQVILSNTTTNQTIYIQQEGDPAPPVTKIEPGQQHTFTFTESTILLFEDASTTSSNNSNQV